MSNQQCQSTEGKKLKSNTFPCLAVWSHWVKAVGCIADPRLSEVEVPPPSWCFHYCLLASGRAFCHRNILHNNNTMTSIIVILMIVCMVLSAWWGHCERSPSSFDKCRLSARWPPTGPTLKPSQQTWHISLPVGCCHPHPQITWVGHTSWWRAQPANPDNVEGGWETSTFTDQLQWFRYSSWSGVCVCLCAWTITFELDRPTWVLNPNASQSLQPFLHSLPQSVPIIYNGPPFPHLDICLTLTLSRWSSKVRVIGQSSWS